MTIAKIKELISTNLFLKVLIVLILITFVVFYCMVYFTPGVHFDRSSRF